MQMAPLGINTKFISAYENLTSLLMHLNMIELFCGVRLSREGLQFFARIYLYLSFFYIIISLIMECQVLITLLPNQGAAPIISLFLVINNLYYFAPGTNHHYGNTGYSILGEILSRVCSFRSGSSKTYKDYLHDYTHGPNSCVPISFHFPHLAADDKLPTSYCCGHIDNIGPGDYALNCQNNMSAHVAEGNGCGTMRMLNHCIRTLMKEHNVLSTPQLN